MTSNSINRDISFNKPISFEKFYHWKTIQSRLDEISPKKSTISNIISLNNGGNSSVYKFNYNECVYILKVFPDIKNVDYSIRLKRELDFLYILEKMKVNNVPRIISHDKSKLWILETYLNGERVSTPNIWQIKSVASFIREINTYSPFIQDCKIQLASEACFSLRDHVEIVIQRMQRIKETLIEKHKKDNCIRAWVENEFCSSLNKIINTSLQENEQEDCFIYSNNFKKILSPSDIGFHNIINNNGKLYFFDFEHAGWDDISKLICDFCNQPEYTLNRRETQIFIEGLRINKLIDKNTLKRCLRIREILIVKWVLIILDRAINREQCNKEEGYDYILNKCKLYYENTLKNNYLQEIEHHTNF